MSRASSTSVESRAELTFSFIDSEPPSPLPGTTPPSAVERFAATNNKSAGDSMSDSNDSILGRDYVVVEKRTVEINALADGAFVSHRFC